MSTEGIPTPRSDAAEIPQADMYDWGTGGSGYVHLDFSQQLETELFLANQNLQAIRELVGEHNDIIPTNKLRKIFNS